MKDPYWTLIGYFNSLRVLGGARMQVQDDVNDRLDLLAAGIAATGARSSIGSNSPAESHPATSPTTCGGWPSGIQTRRRSTSSSPPT